MPTYVGMPTLVILCQ